MATAIVSQIDDQTVDTLLFEFADETLNVFGCARVVFVAGAQCAIVAIETRNLDDPD